MCVHSYKAKTPPEGPSGVSQKQRWLAVPHCPTVPAVTLAVAPIVRTLFAAHYTYTVVICFILILFFLRCHLIVSTAFFSFYKSAVALPATCKCLVYSLPTIHTYFTAHSTNSPVRFWGTFSPSGLGSIATTKRAMNCPPGLTHTETTVMSFMKQCCICFRMTFTGQSSADRGIFSISQTYSAIKMF